MQRADPLDALPSARDLVSAGPAIVPKVRQVCKARQVRRWRDARHVRQVRSARQVCQVRDARHARPSSHASTTARPIDAFWIRHRASGTKWSAPRLTAVLLCCCCYSQEPGL